VIILNNAIYNQIGEKLAGDSSMPASLPKELLNGKFPAIFEDCLFTLLDNGQISAVRAGEETVKILSRVNYSTGTLNKEKLVSGLLLGQFKTDDVNEICNKLHYSFVKQRIVISIALAEPFINGAENILKQLFQEGEAEVIRISDHEAAIIYDACQEIDEVIDLCGAIRETINNELETDAHIGIGSICGNASEIYTSFEHSKAASAVGRRISFYGGVWIYARLFVELLLADLPKDALSKQKLSLNKLSDAIDEDTTALLEELFAQNFNISKTARRLYMHRNTLIYRLDKLEKATGLDMRKFDDAVALRLFIAIERLNK